MVCVRVKMEIQMRYWNKDAMIFIRPWIPILLGLHMQFSWATTCPDECRCDRTFVYCNERSLTSVPLGIGEGYKTLYLHNNQINNAGFPIELHNVASVETVHLYGNQLDEFPVNLPKNTRVLHLQENNIQTVSRAALAQLLRLEELYLDDNSISTVGVEEGAFREAISLKILFLTKNHLSSVPVGLPEDLKELRLDENRIALITDDAFENVTSLELLLLDGNLLTDEGLAPGAFQGLVNLKTLSMARNSLTVPPQNLPTQRLVKLNFQDNLMNAIPLTAFHGLRHLEKLDISSNQLQSLTQGVFDSLLSLRQLTVRNNLWHCDCNIKWVILWLKSLPAALNVRGFMCQKPESVRGMVIRELNLEMIQCPSSTAAVPQSTQWPTSRPIVPDTESVSQTMRPPVNDVTTLSFVPSPSTMPSVHANEEPRTETPEDPGQESLRVSFIVLNSSCVLVNWISTFTVMAYKVTWVRLGHSLSADPVQETMVDGEQQRVHLTNLEPRSMYRICVDPLDAFNNYHVGEDSICSEVVTKPASYDLDEKAEQASQRDFGSSLLLAGLIGGAVLVVLVLMLSVFCWHMHRKGRSPQSKWKYNRGRRKDDYCEAGTKKDNSILEMTETSFQIVSLNNQQLLKGDYQIQPIYTPNGGIGYRDCHVTNNSTFCKNSVPASNPCHT